MAKAVVPVTLGKGVNRDQPPWELELGVWSACSNMRFRAGLDERVGGIASIYTPTIAAYWMMPFAAASGATLNRFLIQAGLTTVYVYDGSSETQITRYTDKNATSLTRSLNVVTGVISSHGLSVGNSFTIYDSTSATTSFNGNFTVASVTDANTITWAQSGVNESATSAGVFSVPTTSAFTATADTKWTGGNLNSIAILNSPNDGIHYWGGSTSNRLRRIRTGNGTDPANWGFAEVVRPYREYLILLGARNNAASGARKPYLISWSKSSDPGTIPGGSAGFTAAATNDAGSVDKTRGVLVDGMEYGGTFYVYQDQGMIAMEWIGGNDVFSFRYLEGSDGLLAANCVCNTPAGQFFFSQNYDLKVHTGGPARSVAEGRMLTWIRDNIDTTYAKRSFLVHHVYRDEVWLCIPTTGSTTVNKALIYNYAADTWGERTLSDVTGAASGMWPTSIALNERMVISTSTPRLGLVDSGTTDFGSAYTSSCERTGMHFDAQGVKKIINRSRLYPDMGNAQTASVYHGSHKLQEESASYASAVTYTHNTTRDINAYAPTAAEYAAFKIETTAASYRLRKFEMHVNSFGNY